EGGTLRPGHLHRASARSPLQLRTRHSDRGQPYRPGGSASPFPCNTSDIFAPIVQPTVAKLFLGPVSTAKLRANVMPRPKPKTTSTGRNPNLVRPHAFKKGHKRAANSGRKKGQANRTTRLLKDAILEAATLVGQDGRGKDGLVGYLKSLAVKEKAVYARLL